MIKCVFAMDYAYEDYGDIDYHIDSCGDTITTIASALAMVVFIIIIIIIILELYGHIRGCIFICWIQT